MIIDLNQYTQIGAAAYTYDLNGSLTSDGANTYTYDYDNRLIEGTVPARGLSLSFKYDPFGRRIEKSLNGTITKYIYDSNQIISETDSQGATQARYIYGANIDEPIMMIRGGSTYFYHFDGLGSVVNLTDSSGNIVESYTYDEYGKPNTTSSIGNPYYFTGREYDTGTELYYYRARYYSPLLGRFLQTDPIGYEAGMNLYTYAENNPINYVDPYGLIEIKGAHNEPIIVHKSDADKIFPSNPHGHILGKPNTKVNPYTGDIFKGRVKVGQLSKKGLKVFQKALKKAGLIGTGVGIVSGLLQGKSSADVIFDALNPLGESELNEGEDTDENNNGIPDWEEEYEKDKINK